MFLNAIHVLQSIPYVTTAVAQECRVGFLSLPEHIIVGKYYIELQTRTIVQLELYSSTNGEESAQSSRSYFSTFRSA